MNNKASEPDLHYGLREVDGLSVAFAEHDAYFSSLFSTPSMGGISRITGADVVLLLAPGKKAADLTDDDVRAALAIMKGKSAT